MAMEFNDEMDCVFKDCFKPAVEAAGFKLPDLREGQPAGLIDDQLRVALRTSRFVIADLTHNALNRNDPGDPALRGKNDGLIYPRQILQR
jgi:hypothetical protein